ncbi:hypothetical protein K7X08_012755 [Anisodus acutangulus]|uniref:Uncharacterized protein n=1 Tax=Anisodus acutangulus TaxID=402998 RepID=A0A9Q1RDV1_9SOLA|nr:hypothetical protein K7X08_012755 [Anisodus acutangulus]
MRLEKEGEDLLCSFITKRKKDFNKRVAKEKNGDVHEEETVEKGGNGDVHEEVVENSVQDEGEDDDDDGGGGGEKENNVNEMVIDHARREIGDTRQFRVKMKFAYGYGHEDQVEDQDLK